MNKYIKNVIAFISIFLCFSLLPNCSVNADAEDEATEDEMHMSNFSKFIICPLGDLINKVLNSIASELTQNEALGIVFSKENIAKTNKLKRELNIKEEKSINEIDPNTIAKHNIPSTIDGKNGSTVVVFTKKTKIPVLPLDIYTMSIGRSTFLDINFWKTTSSNSNPKWLFIQKIILTVAHIVLYISIALILTMLIWRSILFIFSIIGQKPKKAEESKKIMDNIFSAILMVVLIYVFMTLCCSSYDALMSVIIKGDNSPYPIRLVVDDVYSFNTTIIGILRYESLSSNIWNELGWSIAYLVFSIVNIFYFILLFLRMIALGVLSIIAPLTAVMKMTNKKEGKGIINILHFHNWRRVYLKLLCFPLIITLIIRIVFIN